MTISFKKDDRVEFIDARVKSFKRGTIFYGRMFDPSLHHTVWVVWDDSDRKPRPVSILALRKLNILDLMAEINAS